MHSWTDSWLVAVLLATAVGCDEEPYAEIPAETSAPADEPRRAASLEYEDAEDFAILNDRSNLRRDDVSPLEHRRRLNLRFRDELLQQMEGVKFPTDEEIAALSIRWYGTGVGIVIQNPTERRFSASAYFSATVEPACGVTVTMRAVPAGGSVLLSPQDSSECVIGRADVTLTDEYGFLVNQVTVKAEEREP